MMKFRIKIVVDGNGKSSYYPQCRGWFGWKYIGKDYGTFVTSYCKSFVFISNGLLYLEFAKDYIDKYIRQENSKKISSIKHIKYP